MEDLKLSEAQSRYFGDLFLCCCDNEASGKVSYEKATELFRSASLNADLVRQILRIAQIGEGVTQISRRQFYSCLKLISACQAGFEPALSQETLHEDISPMALPRFSWFGANDVNRDPLNINGSSSLTAGGCSSAPTAAVTTNGQSSYAALGKSPDLIELSQAQQQVEQQQQMSRSGPQTNSKSSATAAAVEQPSTDSEVEQNDDSSAIENSDGRRAYGSPNAWSTGSESPTPTNTDVAVKGGKAWHGLLCEEQRQLLGTEEESSDRHSSDDDQTEEAVVLNNHSQHQHHHQQPQHPPIDDQNDQLLYTISEDQRAYYTKQYQAVQKDAAGNVCGPVARVFFEKSRIPVEELRHVWKLCDATKDGALSEAEFMAAMHLIVLRRNQIPLPTKLPRCLQATCILNGNSQAAAPPVHLQEADLLHLNDEEEGRENEEADHQQDNLVDEADGLENLNDCGPESINSVAEERGRDKSAQVPLHLPPVAARTVPPPPLASNPSESSSSGGAGGGSAAAGDWNVSSHASSAAWTKFNESPTAASNVSSPGPKPVHFDIQWTVQAVGADPQILHPVALRLTPQGAEAVVQGTSAPVTKEREREGSSGSPKQLTNQTTGVEFRPIQRPQAKKVKQVPGVGALPPPPVRDSQNMMNMSMDSAAVLSSIRGGGGSMEGQSSSPDDDEDNSSGGNGQPPIPPPRLPITRHTRSSSLDLNKLLLQSSNAAAVPQSSTSLLPEVPPREQPHSMQTQLSCDSKLESTFADFSRFSEAQPPQQSTTVTKATHKPTIPSNRTSAFEVYRKPIPTQVSPVVLDQEKKVAHLEEMLRSLNLSSKVAAGAVRVSGSGESSTGAVVQQLKDQNAVLVNLCLELGNELFAMKYKREEMVQRLQQVDGGGTRTADAVAGGGGGVASGAAKGQTQ